MNSLPKTVTRQRRDCNLNLGPSALESSMLTTRLPSHPNGLSTLMVHNINTIKTQLKSHYPVKCHFDTNTLLVKLVGVEFNAPLQWRI